MHDQVAAPAEPGRLPTGIPGLDDQLSGGYLAGGLYLLVGPAGAGKTTMAAQTAFATAAKGQHVTFVTLFGKTNSQLVRHLRLYRFFDAARVGANVVFYSMYETLRANDLSGLVDTLRQLVRQEHTSLLVLDGLPLDATTPGQYSSRAMSDAFRTFQAFAELLRCTVLITTPSAAGVWESHALLFTDGVLVLDRVTERTTVTRTLNINTFRGSRSVGGLHPCTISETGFALLPVAREPCPES